MWRFLLLSYVSLPYFYPIIDLDLLATLITTQARLNQKGKFLRCKARDITKHHWIQI